MSTPDLATRLLLACDERLAEESRGLAEQLNIENLRRQQEEAEILAQARKAVETDPDVGAHNILVVCGEGWHRGVIGIVASRLVDAFHRPAIVLSIEDGIAHGSCRSISCFDMLGALEGCADLLVRFGGHRHAAGLTLEAARVPEFRKRLTDLADSLLQPDDLRPRLRIDAPLRLRGITGSLIEGLDQMAPFGAGHPRPVFHSAGVELVDGPRNVKDRHLRMSFRQEGRVFPAIAWRAVERAPYLTEHRAALDVAFSLEQSQYRGETYLELHVADVRAAQTSDR